MPEGGDKVAGLTSQKCVQPSASDDGSGILAALAKRGVKAVKACEGYTLPHHSRFSPNILTLYRTVKAVKAFPYVYKEH